MFRTEKEKQLQMGFGLRKRKTSFFYRRHRLFLQYIDFNLHSLQN